MTDVWRSSEGTPGLSVFWCEAEYTISINVGNFVYHFKVSYPAPTHSPHGLLSVKPPPIFPDMYGHKIMCYIYKQLCSTINSPTKVQSEEEQSI